MMAMAKYLKKSEKAAIRAADFDKAVTALKQAAKKGGA
jgi:hypothetical protein